MARKTKFSLAAQDAGFLVDLIGMCKTPGAVLRYGKFTETLVPQVSEFMQLFQKAANKFNQEAEALHKTYYDTILETDPVTGEQKQTNRIKKDKKAEDFSNTYGGVKSEFEAEANKLKLSETEYEMEPIEFAIIFDILKDGVDLAMPNPTKEKDPEIFTAQLYSIMKQLNEVSY